MYRDTLLKVCLLYGMAAALLSMGCAHTATSESTIIRQVAWQAELDECRDVSLSVYNVEDRTDHGAVEHFERLSVEVRPRPELQFERVLKDVELTTGGKSGQFKFDDVEVRADESRRRIWFVDRKAARVIATLDRDTGASTGPDDPTPAWATPDGGVLLETSE